MKRAGNRDREPSLFTSTERLKLILTLIPVSRRVSIGKKLETKLPTTRLCEWSGKESEKQL
jgi:hypothetical protein